MTAPERGRRVFRIAAWLLTPVVAWAASFLGGWVGALLVPTGGPPARGLVWLGAGSVIGALVAVTGWVIFLLGRARWAGEGKPDG